MIRIDDDNALEIVTASQAAGFEAGYLPRESAVGELEGVPVFSENVDLVPESKWLDMAKEVYARGGFIGQRIKLNPDADYQNGLSYCWAYSIAQCVMAIHQIMGLLQVQLAPESLSELTGGRNAGYYCDKAMQYVMRNGIAPREYVSQYELNQRKWKPGWQDARGNFRVLEGFDGGARNIWAETISVLLYGWPCYVGYDWWRHAVMLDGIVLDGNKIGVHAVNTHGPGKDVALFGSKAVPGELYVPRSVTYSG